MFRSGLMKLQLVIDEINDSAASALQAVKLLALYLSGGEQKVCSVTWPLNFFVYVMRTHYWNVEADWGHFSVLLISCESGLHTCIWHDSVIFAMSHAIVLTQHLQEKALSSLTEWLSDSATASNPTLLLIAGMIYTHEQNYNEALKHTHSGVTLDL